MITTTIHTKTHGETMSEQTQLKLKPVGYRIVAKKLEEESTLKGGIILPDSAKKKQETVLVVAVGSSKRLDNGKELPIPVEVGQTILIDKYAGQEVTIDDEDYVVVRADDIVAIIEN